MSIENNERCAFRLTKAEKEDFEILCLLRGQKKSSYIKMLLRDELRDWKLEISKYKREIPDKNINKL